MVSSTHLKCFSAGMKKYQGAFKSFQHFKVVHKKTYSKQYQFKLKWFQAQYFNMVLAFLCSILLMN